MYSFFYYLQWPQYSGIWWRFFAGCALWMESPFPRLGSCRPAAATLLWEPKGSRNFHMWSCWFQKLPRGISHHLYVSRDDLCLFHSTIKHRKTGKLTNNNDQVFLFVVFRHYPEKRKLLRRTQVKKKSHLMFNQLPYFIMNEHLIEVLIHCRLIHSLQ